ncbi:Type 1 glutamine amidotransferase-like domain-containing protein [Moraxella sp.]|uniref:Type 1 glutamine amidotransferase-like domain-containing protein n=1 Tax=Moraxella sp. TaxID=479 RepID=UPI0026DCDEC5|nr:Type 1 glutamine amidotransferase-like domain-containing protein [Moraxella sp.]MDO4894237.1 Type 1 glutamine amidotransferase-like domain-containing protein [Moraxella sp.]
MKNLFLTSSFADTAKFLPEFLHDINKSQQFKKVAFIDIASQIEEYKGYVDNAKNAFTELKLSVNIIDFNQSSDDIKEQINQCDMIYVSGGNTLYLLQQLKLKNIDIFLIDWIKQGKPYLGESAGTVILAKNIEYILPIENHTDRFTDFVGLGMIDFYPVVHFDNEPFIQGNKVIFDNCTDTNLIAFNNYQALIIYGNRILFKS